METCLQELGFFLDILIDKKKMCHGHTFFAFTRQPVWTYGVTRPVHFKWKRCGMFGQRRRQNVFFFLTCNQREKKKSTILDRKQTKASVILALQDFTTAHALHPIQVPLVPIMSSFQKGFKKWTCAHTKIFRDIVTMVWILMEWGSRCQLSF